MITTAAMAGQSSPQKKGRQAVGLSPIEPYGPGCWVRLVNAGLVDAAPGAVAMRRPPRPV